jgi:hypothetical protein
LKGQDHAADVATEVAAAEDPNRKRKNETHKRQTRLTRPSRSVRDEKFATFSIFLGTNN